MKLSVKNLLMRRNRRVSRPGASAAGHSTNRSLHSSPVHHPHIRPLVLEEDGSIPLYRARASRTLQTEPPPESSESGWSIGPAELAVERAVTTAPEVIEISSTDDFAPAPPVHLMDRYEELGIDAALNMHVLPTDVNVRYGEWGIEPELRRAPQRGEILEFYYYVHGVRYRAAFTIEHFTDALRILEPGFFSVDGQHLRAWCRFTKRSLGELMHFIGFRRSAGWWWELLVALMEWEPEVITDECYWLEGSGM